MYLFLILFFLSLIGITIMIWRELILIRNGKIAQIQHVHPLSLDIEKMKLLLLRGAKRTGYITVFLTLRLSIKTSNFLKINSKILIKKIKNKLFKNKNNVFEEIIEKKEVSKYLRIISEYRHKIREMKHRIEKEEGIE